MILQAPGTQPQAQEEPRLQSSSPKCLQGQVTVSDKQLSLDV